MSLQWHWHVPTATLTCLFRDIDMSFEGCSHFTCALNDFHMSLKWLHILTCPWWHIYMSLKKQSYVSCQALSYLLRDIHIMGVSGKGYLLVHWWIFTCLVRDFKMSLEDIQSSLEGNSNVCWRTFQCSLRDIYVSFEWDIYVPWETSIIKVFP